VNDEPDLGDRQGPRVSRRFWLLATIVVLALLAIAIHTFGFVPGDSGARVIPEQRITVPEQSSPSGPGDPRRVSVPERRSLSTRLRHVAGAVRLPSGRPAPAKILLDGPVRGTRTVQTTADALGTYSAGIPASWTFVTASASAPYGYRGSVQADVLHGDDVLELDDIVMHRHVKVTLLLNYEPDAHAILAGHTGTTLAVLARRRAQANRRSLLIAQDPGKKLATFEPKDGEVQRVVTETISDVPMELAWVRYPKHSFSTEIMRTEIPVNAEAVESKCVVRMSMVLFGSVEDASKKSTPYVEMEVISEGTGQLFHPRTDEDGSFAVPVPENSYGTVKVDGADCGPARWMAGVGVNVRCDLGSRIRVRLVDPTGAPVPEYSISVYNNQLRKNDGTIDESTRLVSSPNGTQVTPFTKLKEGTVLYILLPGKGEVLHVCPREISASEKPYKIIVGEGRHGSDSVVLRSRDISQPVPGVFIHMVGDPMPKTKQRNEYRFALLPSKVGSVWTARHVLPGRYEYVVTVRGEKREKGTIEVRDGETAEVRVIL